MWPTCHRLQYKSSNFRSERWHKVTSLNSRFYKSATVLLWTRCQISDWSALISAVKPAAKLLPFTARPSGVSPSLKFLKSSPDLSAYRHGELQRCETAAELWHTSDRGVKRAAGPTRYPARCVREIKLTEVRFIYPAGQSPASRWQQRRSPATLALGGFPPSRPDEALIVFVVFMKSFSEAGLFMDLMMPVITAADAEPHIRVHLITPTTTRSCPVL